MTPADSWGQGCEAYSWSSPDDWSYYQMTYWTYGPTCGEQDDDDFTAADLCCACGGGLDEAPEPVVLAVSLTVEMDCADCALKGGVARARALARPRLVAGEADTRERGSGRRRRWATTRIASRGKRGAMC